MFKNIIFVSNPDYGYTKYRLIDTSFKEEVTIRRNTAVRIVARRVIAVAKVYRARSLPVPNNIARVYIYSMTEYSDINEYSIIEDARKIDLYLPELKYTENYLNCVLRQFKQLRYRITI